MEGASALSPSSWEKRRAWVRQSRCWRTTVLLEEEAAVVLQDVPELQPPHLDDVFLDGGRPGGEVDRGSSSSKIETWLQDCGVSMEVLPEEPGLLAPFGCSSNGTSFEDDLTLGAEALLLSGNDKAANRKTLLAKPWPGQNLHLGNSMASSALSSGTNKTVSSLSEILEWCQEDAEEILFNLGFVQDEPQAAARIPSRFFSAPSQAKGINFQLFLKAQVQRLEMEDPCLTLASRFQQVEALAATADAFFCLYSYVSKTPLQKISPAQVFWSCPEIPSTWVVPTKVEATSPVDRLKKAISKMCLYTSPKSESPHRASKAPSCQRSSLGRVVQEVLERAREERFQFAQTDIEGMQGADWEMPTGTVQCWHREQSSSQELSEPENNSPEHLCHGGETAPTPPGGQGERHTVPALRRLQWAPQGLPDGRGRACAEGPSNPGQKEKKGPGETPLEVAPSKWEVPLDVSCPSRGAGSDEQGSQVGDTVAPWSYLIPSPGTHCEASNARGALGTMWLHLEPREGLRSEAGFALDLSRTLSWDNARSCAACLADPRGAPEKDGREDHREEEPRAEGKPHALPTGSSRTRGSQDAVCPQGWDSKDSGPALFSSGEVPASWAAGGDSMLHGPRQTLTLPLQEDDSFEMEEVQSASEDEDGAPEAEAWLPAPALPRHRRSFMLHAHSAQSDSSGFVEEPVPDLTPSTQLHGTAGSQLCRPMEGPCDTGQVSLAENSSEQQGDTSCLQVTHGFAAHPKPLLEL